MAKFRAIKEAPAPKDEQQLRSFLGLLNYYGKFLSNLLTTLAPLHSLLEKGKDWHWTKAHQNAFDSKKEVILACDAGVGAVLAHKFPDGSEHPVAFASRTLAPAKFHNFLFGRQFTIFTDHKPLKHLFGEDKPIPPMASARLQRWALKLSAYQYKIAHKPGKDNANADVLSRLPLPEYPMEVTLPGETVMLLETLQSSPVNAKQIAEWTAKDPVLSKVKKWFSQGWTDTDDHGECVGRQECLPHV